MSTIPAPTHRGETSPLDARGLSELRAGLEGELILPDEPGYDAARAIWNGMIRRRPALIVRCAGTADVSHAIRFARRHALAFSVRSGGHNIAGTALVDGGMVVDLSSLRGIEIDLATGRVTVEPGCTLGDVDRATQAHGLVVPSGIVSETGIAGLTVGGGFGWLTRKHGLTSDNLLSAEVVLADGTRAVAGPDENAELFWGIRGGGGNFGVVTRFEFQAYPLGPQVVAGMVVWPFEQAADVMSFYRTFSATLPEDAGSLLVIRPAPPAPFLPPEAHGKMIVGIAGMYAGPLDEGARVFAPVAAFGRPLGGGLTPKPFLAHQTMFDAGQPKGRQYYWKSEYLEGLSAATDRVLLDHGGRIESPHTAILCFQLGGAMARVPESASAAGHRKAGFVVNIAGAWDDPARSARHTAWVRGCWEALHPHSMGTYVNFLTEEADQDRVRAAYGSNFARLAELKARFDPDNVLRANQNIAPAPMPPA